MADKKDTSRDTMREILDDGYQKKIISISGEEKVDYNEAARLLREEVIKNHAANDTGIPIEGLAESAELFIRSINRALNKLLKK